MPELTTSVIAEALAALAVIINFIGYRQTNVNRYRLISAMALICLGIHFLMIDALAAAVACLLSCVRNFIAMVSQHLTVAIIFVTFNLGFWAWEAFILGHSWIIVFAYMSSIIFTVGTVLLSTTSAIRKWFIVAESLGLVYAILVGSIFGSVFNITNLISILSKLYADRHKRL